MKLLIHICFQLKQVLSFLSLRYIIIEILAPLVILVIFTQLKTTFTRPI